MAEKIDWSKPPQCCLAPSRGGPPMSETPERIWAVVRGGGVSYPSHAPYVMGSFEDRPDDKAVEYVRADVAADRASVAISPYRSENDAGV